MDKRYKALTPSEALAARRTLVDELAAQPSTPIPQVIRKIRTALRLTIAEYATLCGVSARALADIEREATSPTLATVEKLLRPMGLRPGAVAVGAPQARPASAAPQAATGAQERSRIDVSAEWEVEYWCTELGVTEAALRAAVQAVGPTVAAVRQYLAAPRRQRPG
ncbi:DUF3606 domain-containing protein [Pseudoduganella armeniaca]|uniref:DUF3606 domain-containing protein n=1 Tax=Pseudoduganella armeniaca TaxID=2072590 RepID=UPI0026BC4FDB|nr:DUF3606 domain-containing protein [Pseudoduganella armeniaca]